MRKLLLLAALGVGYVLGARAGRQRYEQLRQSFQKVKSDPRVQEKTQQLADLAKEQAPVVKEKVAAAAGAAKEKVTSSSSSDTADREELLDELHPDSTARQADPYPKGDLP